MNIQKLIDKYYKSKDNFYLESEKILKELGNLRFEEPYLLTKDIGSYSEEEYEILGINDGQLEIFWSRDESKSSFLQTVDWLELSELEYFLHFLNNIVNQ